MNFEDVKLNQANLFYTIFLRFVEYYLLLLEYLIKEIVFFFNFIL